MTIFDDTDVEEPLRVTASSDLDWDQEADMVVIGFGGAGASAAIEGRERGLSVIAVDRFGGGGATAFSGGVFYACNTPIQEQAGFSDTADNMFAYLDAEGAPVRSETLRRFCDGSSQDFAWVSRNVPYDPSYYEGKVGYPPEGKFLFYSGNERTKRFAQVAKAVPRGHRAVGKGLTGKVFYEGLRKAAVDADVTIIRHAPARRLVIDCEGRVIGVEIVALSPAAAKIHERIYRKMNPQLPFRGNLAGAREKLRRLVDNHGIRRLIRAHKGVVLAAGAFTNNPTWVAKHRPDLATAYDDLMRLGSLGCDGSGMSLGMSAGGRVDLMSNAYIGKTVSPPEILLHGILVNRGGARFVNEDAYSDVVGSAIAVQPDNGAAYLVCDGRVFWQAIKDQFTSGLLTGLASFANIAFGGTKRGSTLRRLARKCRIDESCLERTVRTYNARIRSGADDNLGKLAAYFHPISDTGPYFAIDMSLSNKFALHMLITLGGLIVDEESGHVLREDGSPIAGLYAAGRNAVGLCSGGYVSGMSLADLVFSGRRAARDIAQGL